MSRCLLADVCFTPASLDHTLAADVDGGQSSLRGEVNDAMPMFVRDSRCDVHHCIDCLSIDEGEGLIQIIGAVDADGDECDTQFPGGGLCRHERTSQEQLLLRLRNDRGRVRDAGVEGE